MQYLRLIALQGIGLLLSLTCLGQQAIDGSYRFHHLTPDDGLSQVSIESILHDSRNYVWVGTQNGLNRYDGHRFHVFKHHPADSTSLSGNSISALFEDNRGRIWVGTDNRGLSIYLPDANRFFPVQIGSLNNSGNVTITSIERGAGDDVWVGTRHHGLYRVQAAGQSSFTANRVGSVNPELNAITALYYHDDHGLFIGCPGHVLAMSLDKGHFEVSRLNMPVLQGVVKVIASENNKLWVGTEAGLYFYDSANEQSHVQDLVDPVSTSQQRPYEINDLHVSAGQLWVAAGHGLVVLADWKPTVQRYSTKQFYNHNANDGSTLSHSSVLCLSIDTRQIFIGTSRFLNLLHTKPAFELKRRAQSAGTSINNNIIFSFYKDSVTKDLWIGTSGGGLNLERNNKYYYFIESNRPKSISDNIIRGIEKGPENTLWLATTKGLSIVDLSTFDPNKPVFQTYISEFSPQGLAHNNLRDVLYADGQIWIISAGGGLSRFIGNVSQDVFSFETFRHQVDDDNSLSADFIHSIIPDQRPHSYWLGTENGLCHVAFDSADYSNPKFTRYQHQSDDRQTIPDNAVHDLAYDTSGILWIGTGYGLASFDQSAHSFRRYYEEDGLTGNVIYSIQPDDFGRLWIGTSNGLSIFDPEAIYFRNYDDDEGLQDREFNIKSKLKDEEGYIYLGGIAGFNVFDPREFISIPEPTPIYIEYVKTDNSDVQFQNGSVNLTQKSFPLHIGFSAPDANPLRTIQYEYLLEPTRNTWNSLRDQNSISFPDLAPDNYLLKIRGNEGGRPWASAPLELTLDVIPPWWRSNWAFFIYALLFASLGYTFYRFQLQRKLAREESRRLKELDLVKNKLYTNITHEFRTPLTVILGLLEELKTNSPEPDKSAEFLNIIEKNGTNLLTLVNQLLDLSKLEQGKSNPDYVQGNIISFIQQIITSFQSLAKAKSISLVFYTEIDSLEMDFDEQRMAQILGNLVGNAIKFCQPKDEIIVHTQFLDKANQLLLKIKDSGPGIDAADLPYIFDRYFQIEDSRNRFGGGSGIGLALTKELVELLDGHLDVQSALDRGTTFFIKLPVRNLAPTTAPTVPTALASQGVQSLDDSSVIHDPDRPDILIIEDNLDVAYYLKTCLSASFNTRHAADGTLGIELALEVIPDIIVCDIMMPGKNGFEVCKTLKTDIRTNHIPIILLTAKTGEHNKIEGLQTGADAYLTKPFSKKELIVRIEQLMLLRERLKEKFQASLAVLPASIPVATPGDDPNSSFIQEAVGHILDHVDDPLLKGPFLARKIGLSESQLYRKLKALTGKSTALFIRHIRLQKARQMLANEELNVSEVAYACGFSDPAWFSRVFKEEYGISPSGVKS